MSLGQEEAPAPRGLSSGKGAGVPGAGLSVAAGVGGIHRVTGSCKAHGDTGGGRWSCGLDTSRGSAPTAAPPRLCQPHCSPQGLPAPQTHPNKMNKMPIKEGSQPVLHLDGTSPVPAWREVDGGQGSYAEGLGREDKAGVVPGRRGPGVALWVPPVRRLSPRVMRPA